jgi:hypothetical protein
VEKNSAKCEHTASSEPEKAAIRKQLDRLLDSSFFRQSKRIPDLLRFVTERTLSGEIDEIKERTIGVEVFGKDPDYETATDPIVRVTAREIRKRVAQYYLEPGHENELRITLPSGSYIPKFSKPGVGHGDDSQSEVGSTGTQDKTWIGFAQDEMLDLADLGPGKQQFFGAKQVPISDETLVQARTLPEARLDRHPARRAQIAVFTCIVAGLLAAGAVFIERAFRQSPFDFFWKPVLGTNEPVLICVADELQDSGIALRDSIDPSQLHWLNDPLKKNAFLTVALDNVNVAAKLIEVLQSKHKQYILRGEATTNLSDLRSGPAIFVGGFDNAWSLRMTSSLRFRLANDPGLTSPRIADSEAPTKPGWRIDQPVGTNGTYHDYAIVARFTDRNTGKPVVVVAGIGRCASLAAGQFVGDEDDLAELQHAAMAAGNKRNIEVVLSTQVVDGHGGSPRIEATYFW